ncbi:hypothetical protein AAKU55_003651 [Oxalobacteraceae bacterium GrIS 1.11]
MSKAKLLHGLALICLALPAQAENSHDNPAPLGSSTPVDTACNDYAAPEPEPDARAPKAFWVSQPLRPDQTALISAGNIDPASTLQIAMVPDCAIADPLDSRRHTLNWMAQTPLQASTTTLKFVVPTQWPAGLFAYRLTSAGVAGAIHYINQPDPWFIQGDQGDSASPGGWLQVHGTALALEPAAAAPALALVRENRVVAILGADAADPMNNGYRQRFKVPADTPDGSYEVYVHNGHGAVQGWHRFSDVWSSDGKPIEHVIVKRPLPWPTVEVDVTQQAGANWDQKFAAAISLVQASGGGVIRVPAGEYQLVNQLSLPNKTLLLGAGTELTVLTWAGAPRDAKGNPLALLNGRTVVPYPVRNASFSVSDLTLISGKDEGICIHRGYTVEPAYLRRVACRFPNLASSAVTGSSRPTSGIGVDLGDSSSNFEVSDSYFNVRTGFYLRSQGGANAYIRFTGNVVRWRDDEANQRYNSHNIVYEGNHTSYAGTFLGNGYTRAMNANPGFWFAAYEGNARDLYYGNNRTDHEDPTPLDGALGMTFDGGSGAYYGAVHSADGVTVELAEPSKPYERFGIKPGAWVAILSGAGAGQWRTLAANLDGSTHITVDRPWDIAPDASSTLTIWRTLGRALFVHNDLAGKRLLQTYYASHDVIFANNHIGTPGATVGVPIWVGGTAGNGTAPGWHYQVLDNSIDYLGASFDSVPTGAPLPGTAALLAYAHIFRNNQSSAPGTAVLTIFPAGKDGRGRPNTGFIVEKNGGMASIPAGGSAPYSGLIRDNQSLLQNAPGKLADFTTVTAYDAGNKEVLLTPLPGNWVSCAREGGTCNFPGIKLVRFGANGHYVMQSYQDSAACSNAGFKSDPIPGNVKSCDYDGGIAP